MGTTETRAGGDTRPTLDPAALLAGRFSAAIARAFPDASGGAEALVAPSKRADLGDFQCNAAMPLGKALGRAPREVAREIVAAVDLGDLVEGLNESAIAGPGFINIRLRAGALGALLERLDGADLGLPPVAQADRVVVDLAGVNLAKQMHVGHIRSIVIGDAIARLLGRVGHEVIRQNHVGDWGLPIAMVVDELARREREGTVSFDTLTLDDLDAIYRLAQRRSAAGRAGLRVARRWSMGPKVLAELEAEVADADAWLEGARRTLVALQSGEGWALSIWRRVRAVTMDACLAACRRLHADIDDDDSAGESSYADELGPMVEDLARRGVAEEDDGALVVRGDGADPPALIRKRDGGYLYATTDLAAIRRRVREMGATRVVYLVDLRQSLHFRQVFAAARRAGYATTADGRDARLEHAGFGTILGTDGRPYKSRSGENVRLRDLLDEAHERAERILIERGGQEEPADRAGTAEAVAVAAMKFADLAPHRERDYVFDFDQILAFEGDTGPYLLYAVVRIRGVFREAQQRGLSERWRRAPLAPREEAEKRLALALLRHPAVLAEAAERLEPHRLCAHLLAVATAFSGFYAACPVLAADDDAARDSRLRLCALTARVLEDGLGVLGMPILDRM